MIVVTNDQQYPCSIPSQGNPASLLLAMFLVKVRQGLRVKKYCGRTFKGDTMFFLILSGLGWVPFKLILERFLQAGIISQTQVRARRVRGRPNVRGQRRPASTEVPQEGDSPAASTTSGRPLDRDVMRCSATATLSDPDGRERLRVPRPP